MQTNNTNKRADGALLVVVKSVHLRDRKLQSQNMCKCSAVGSKFVLGGLIMDWSLDRTNEHAQRAKWVSIRAGGLGGALSPPNGGLRGLSPLEKFLILKLLYVAKTVFK